MTTPHTLPSRILSGCVMLALIILAIPARSQDAIKKPRKVCIAHRGASAYAPEHTFASYRKAMEMNADFVEPDLQMTKDGVLVCMHDVTLERTTNVAEIYPDRASDRDPSGRSKKSWRVSDFTLAEIKKLDAGRWFDPAFADERVPTFQEMIDLVKTKPGTGIYPETKDPEFYKAVGLKMDEELLRVLKLNGLDTPEGQAKMPLFIQSFSPESLKHIRQLSGKTYKLIQLVDAKQVRALISDTGLPQVAEYADGLGPAIPILLSDPSRVAAAHKFGLALHPYTVDAEQVPAKYVDAKTYMNYLLYDLGVDGLFTNNSDLFPRR